MRTAAAGFFATEHPPRRHERAPPMTAANRSVQDAFSNPQETRGVMQTADPNRHPITAEATSPTRPGIMSSNLSKKELEDLIQSLWVLVVDDNQYMRKMVRNLLVNCGVKDIYEAADGIAALDAIRTLAPDIVILDWEMPLLSGPELVRIVRSPGVFPMPDVPIIMLSGHGERWRVIEAVRLGVNEYLIKPVSAKAIYDRLISILTRPRPAVQLGDYYGPEPRKLLTDSLDGDALATTLADAVVN
jgi:two-component system, chemotaxis family, chemotaxis protein CheY